MSEKRVHQIDSKNELFAYFSNFYGKTYLVFDLTFNKISF